MRLDELPDLALHKICLKLPAKDITSLQETKRKLFQYIRANRLYYNRNRVKDMIINLTDDGHRFVQVVWKENGMRLSMTLKGSVDDVIKSFVPEVLQTYDHDKLANMHPLWWKGISHIEMHNVVDIRRYLPHFDRCKVIIINSNNSMILSEIMSLMETKNMHMLSVSGNGELECTDEDMRKIGRLSNEMKNVILGNISESSNISNDAILDMIEIGSFIERASIYVSKIQDDLAECLEKRDWVIHHRTVDNDTLIEKADGLSVHVRVMPRSWPHRV